MKTWYRGAYVVDGGEVLAGGGVVVEDGVIVGRTKGGERPEGAFEEVDLGNVAVMAGQINVHSHAFQRAMRGATERVGDTEKTFWGWREVMYGLANGLSADEIEAVAELAFWEMSRAGIVEVGEFHYVHHDREGRPYEDVAELAGRVMRAADRVGIRLMMLPVAYHTGDIGQAALEEQRRFVFGEVEEYLAFVGAVEEKAKAFEKVRVGMAPHSIRAVPRKWMEAIGARAVEQNQVVHIHVCEQRRELVASKAAYGLTPVEALYDWGGLTDKWTLVHGTHLSDREFGILEEVRPTVGACPGTERNLGDGFLPARELVKRGVPIALGSDSHTIIDPFEEMRLVEYHERLRFEGRNVLGPETAEILWAMGTTLGARSLGRKGGHLGVGMAADFVALDLGAPALVGSTSETLLSNVVMSGTAAMVRDVVVGGEFVVKEGRHREEEQIVEKFQDVMADVAGRNGRK